MLGKRSRIGGSGFFWRGAASQVKDRNRVVGATAVLILRNTQSGKRKSGIPNR
jgi:hypothetical protein